MPRRRQRRVDDVSWRVAVSARRFPVATGRTGDRASPSRESQRQFSQPPTRAGSQEGGEIRLRRVMNVSAESLLDFIRETVEPGATIHTDGWKGYAGLPAAGYKHRVTVISGGDEQAHEVMPRVHNVASLLKRWLLGSVRSRVVFNNSISITTSMNSRFASTVVAQVPADCSFTASPSRP
ncbi:MAG: transposase [Sulfurisoma sp.]|nr:transposase [Sulfurisoma sp.]